MIEDVEIASIIYLFRESVETIQWFPSRKEFKSAEITAGQGEARGKTYSTWCSQTRTKKRHRRLIRAMKIMGFRVVWHVLDFNGVSGWRCAWEWEVEQQNNDDGAKRKLKCTQHIAHTVIGYLSRTNDERKLKNDSKEQNQRKTSISIISMDATKNKPNVLISGFSICFPFFPFFECMRCGARWPQRHPIIIIFGSGRIEKMLLQSQISFCGIND